MSSLILPPIKPSHYRPDIDGLRAIAIVSVVIFHTFPTQLPGGFVGVDVFFVISGYLISTIIFRSLEKESFSFLDFYARRIRRIFPALAFLLLGVILLGSLFLTPEEFKNSESRLFMDLHLERTFSLSVIPVVIGIQLPK